jgi:mono/diheme cytochrome c family protein
MAKTERNLREASAGFFSRAVKLVIAVFFLTLTLYTVAAHEKEHPQMSPGDRHWKAPPEAANRQNPEPATAESIDRGRKLFEKHCVVCHGPEGRGDTAAAARLNPKPANLVRMAGHHPDGDIAWKIANGRGPMPAWKETLSQKDIWHLTNFVQSLGQ